MTGKLGAINRYNGLDIPSGYFMEAMERLSNRYLNIPLDAVIHPVSTEVRKVVKGEQVAANNALIQQWENIKELVKPAEEKHAESSSPNRGDVKNEGVGEAVSKDESKIPSLRIYGIGASILLLVMLGISGIRALIQNVQAKGTPTSTLTSQLISANTMTPVPPTQALSIPTSTETPVPLTPTFTVTPTLGIGSTI